MKRKRRHNRDDTDHNLDHNEPYDDPLKSGGVVRVLIVSNQLEHVVEQLKARVDHLCPRLELGPNTGDV